MDNKENWLVLHIGSPKTGTTAWQSMFLNNQDVLRRYGWAYPDLLAESRFIFEKKRTSFSRWRNGIIIKDTLNYSWSNNSKEKLWKIIRRHLENSNVLLSDEGMWLQPEAIDFLCERYKRIKVVIYLRRQDLFIDSLWGFEVKARKDYCDNIMSLIDSYNIDFLTNIKEFEKKVGKENIIVRAFEREQLVDGDAIADIIHIMNTIAGTWLQKTDLVASNDADNDNRGLDKELLPIKLYMNKALSEEKVDLSMYWNSIISENTLNNGTGHYLPLEERKKILNRYSEDNSYIARYYMNRDDGKLFTNCISDYTEDSTELSHREKILFKALVKAVKNK